MKQEPGFMIRSCYSKSPKTYLHPRECFLYRIREVRHTLFTENKLWTNLNIVMIQLE